LRWLQTITQGGASPIFQPKRRIENEMQRSR
jgi:hypothetical protein